jgi:hypothetical protein
VPLACRILRQHDAPAASRRMSPSLVSNSTSPVSQSTSKRRGGLCQSTSHIPVGTWQMLHHEAGRLSERRSGGLSSKSFFGCNAISTSSGHFEISSWQEMTDCGQRVAECSCSLNRVFYNASHFKNHFWRKTNRDR